METIFPMTAFMLHPQFRSAFNVSNQKYQKDFKVNVLNVFHRLVQRDQYAARKHSTSYQIEFAKQTQRYIFLFHFFRLSKSIDAYISKEEPFVEGFLFERATDYWKVKEFE
jgi:hypothetical protein